MNTAIRFKFGTEMEDGPRLHRQCAVFASLSAFHYFLDFWFLQRVQQLTLISVDFRSVHPKTCFGRFVQRVKSSVFLTPKTIFKWAE